MVSVLKEEIMIGKIRYFDWQKGEGRLIQSDGTELFFNLKGARMPATNLFDGTYTWIKPAEPYPRGILAGKEILYKIHRGPHGKFAKFWVLKEHQDLYEGE